MSGFGKDHLALLLPAIEAARKALRDLDEKEVPANLRRVASRPGGRLPPPLAKTLLEAVDSDEWFLDKVRQVWVTADKQTPAMTASEAFLLRPDGWWLSIADALAASATASVAAERDALERELQVAGGRLSEAKRRLRETTAAPGDRSPDLERLTADRDRLRNAVDAERRLAKKMDAERLALVAAVDEERALRAEAEQRVSVLRERWRRERRSRAEAERVAATGETRSLDRDPLAMARQLDRIAAVARVGRPGEEAGEAATKQPRRNSLPAGLAPDSADAIRWLLAQPDPFTLIVDGYNVLFLVDRDDFTSGRARQRLNHDLERFRRSARARPRVVVVYDSALPGERQPPQQTKSIEVRFAPEAVTADEEVGRLAAVATPPVFVVSTDREVQADAERCGAAALWSESLVEWMKG